MTEDDFDTTVEIAMISRAFDIDPWTYGEMCAIEGQLPGAELRKQNGHGRAVSKIQQRWHRKGWAQFARFGRNTFWTLTDAGKSSLWVYDTTRAATSEKAEEGCP